ncbi:MAG: EamA family transporter [Gammaproteobacteria bacterium]|nr:EamA family transporter [Gammaproteobacteria bacterium]
MTSAISVIKQDRHYYYAAALTLLGAVMFSAKSIFIKFAYQYQVDTVTLLTIRMGIAVPVYLLIGYYSERFHDNRVGISQLFAIAMFGFIGYYLASYLDMQGLQYITVSLERMILYLYPTFVLLLSVIVLKQKITKREVVALVVAYLGLMFIFIEDMNVDFENSVLGGLLVMMSAFAFAVFMIGSNKHINLVGSVRFTAYAMSAAGFAVFVHYAVSDRVEILQQPDAVYFWGVALAVISTILPSFFISHGIKVLGVKKVSLLGVIGPVSTMILSVIILGEAVTVVRVIGLVIVVVAVTSIVIVKKADNDS